MLRLRSCVLAHLLSPNSASILSPLHRLLSAAAAPRISPNPSFAVDDYLVATCGLTRAQALKASAKLSHLKSPSKPDAVLAFLAGLGLSGDDVAALVAKDPKFLCASVERTLVPIVAGLSGLRLSRPEIASLVSVAGEKFRCRTIVCTLRYFLTLFASSGDLLRMLRRGAYVLSTNLERVIKPNAAFLSECRLGARDIAKLCAAQPRMLTADLERVRAMVACADGLGVPRASRMFWRVLNAVAFLHEKNVAAKIDYLKDTFGWSDHEAGIAVCKAPMLLALSRRLLKSKSEFLISEVGLEPAYLAHRSVLPTYSLEGRLRPRYHAMNFLKENGLLDDGRDYYCAVALPEKVFVDKFIRPHKEAAPQLAQDYAAACKGELPARFRFT